MPRRALALAVLVAIALTACTSSPPSTPSPPKPEPAAPPAAAPTSTLVPVTPAPAGLIGVLAAVPPADQFVAEVTNPYMPLPVGTTYAFSGKKDGKSTSDVNVVTTRKKVVAGVSCTVVTNELRTADGKRLYQLTEDWYAQDKAGNVWYFGEDTKEFDEKGKVIDTSGSWEAGKDGALPGVFMPANPKVGDRFYQEYQKGHVEDVFEILSVTGEVTVPFGKFTNVVVTKEISALEPDLLSEKSYASGPGCIFERDVKGGDEWAKLATVTKK